MFVTMKDTLPLPLFVYSWRESTNFIIPLYYTHRYDIDEYISVKLCTDGFGTITSGRMPKPSAGLALVINGQVSTCLKQCASNTSYNNLSRSTYE